MGKRSNFKRDMFWIPHGIFLPDSSMGVLGVFAGASEFGPVAKVALNLVSEDGSTVCLTWFSIRPIPPALEAPPADWPPGLPAPPRMQPSGSRAGPALGAVADATATAAEELVRRIVQTNARLDGHRQEAVYTTRDHTYISLVGPKVPLGFLT